MGELHCTIHSQTWQIAKIRPFWLIVRLTHHHSSYATVRSYSSSKYPNGSTITCSLKLGLMSGRVFRKHEEHISYDKSHLPQKNLVALEKNMIPVGIRGSWKIINKIHKTLRSFWGHDASPLASESPAGTGGETGRGAMLSGACYSSGLCLCSKEVRRSFEGDGRDVNGDIMEIS